MTRAIIKSLFVFFVICVCCVPGGYCGSANFEIPDGMVWLNSNRPVKVSDLKGKFVLVYFWHYAGMNIQSVIEQCRDLETKFPRELVVIGIHSGKALDDDELNRHVVDALRIYRIAYPVAVDHNLETLKAFRFDQWPAAVLFAPDGSVLTSKTGERDLYYLFSRMIVKNIPRYQRLLNDQVIVFQSPDENKSGALTQEGATPANLPAKVTGVQLMGNTILNDPINQVEVPSAIVQKSSDPVIEEIKTEEPIETPKATAPDVSHFIGEKIALDREYSQKIGTITLKFRLPDHARLLGAAQSYVRVFTDDHVVWAQGLIKNPQTRILMDHEIPNDRLNIEAMLYYCMEGPKAICRIKGFLFTVHLSAYPKQENILIEHDIATQ